jgi:DNA-binding transcriptional regulator YhcF (GntR family)
MRKLDGYDSPVHPNKYQAIFVELQEAIRAGKYKEGQRIPSETQLSRRFGASRLTVGRALNELEAAGLIERRAGSGSYVTQLAKRQGRTFGLLIPELGETEIFEPICQGMARASRATHDELIWGAATRDVESHEQQALQLCDYYISKDVSGVFFAPLEYKPGRNEVNAQILEKFQRAADPRCMPLTDITQAVTCIAQALRIKDYLRIHIPVDRRRRVNLIEYAVVPVIRARQDHRARRTAQCAGRIGALKEHSFACQAV